MPKRRLDFISNSSHLAKKKKKVDTYILPLQVLNLLIYPFRTQEELANKTNSKSARNVTDYYRCSKKS